MTCLEKLAQMGLQLPPAPQAIGAYRTIVTVDDVAYLSGHLPIRHDGSLICGRVGDDLDPSAGYDAARQTGLNLLATLQAALGDLHRVRKIVKLVGLVNSAPDFYEHPAVINGCSELMAELFGSEIGVGARSALGAAALPKNAAVEIEAIVQIAP